MATLEQEQPRAFPPDAQSRQARVPGAAAALLIAIISALLTGYWGRPRLEAPRQSAPWGSLLAEVSPADIGAALDTMDISPEAAMRFRNQQACRRKLAWVTLAGVPQLPGGKIRLRSGGYISPAFALGDVPVRVAIPYPAPYPAGHGTIAVMGATTDAIVALTPPWHVSARQDSQSREVTWIPNGFCPVEKP